MYTGEVKATATPYLNVRNAPKGGKVGRLYPGDAVILEYINAEGWGKLIDPVVSNNADKQWLMASFIDLSQETEPEPHEEEEPPEGQPEAVPSSIHISFEYDEKGALAALHVLEQFSDGSDLARDWYPQSEQ